MRNYFDEQLALLNTELIEMGALCEDIIAITPRALEAGSASTVKKATSIDAEIRRKERDIEGLCLIWSESAIRRQTWPKFFHF